MGKSATALRALLSRGLPIIFETGDKKKDPNSIRWRNVRAVEEGNS